MLRYILKRVVSAIITIWFIMTSHLLPDESHPGDPFPQKNEDPVIIENMKAKYGLDRPPSEQYVKYLSDYAHGDFGISFMKRDSRPTTSFPPDFRTPDHRNLGLRHRASVGVFFGIIALRQNKFVDRLLMFCPPWAPYPYPALCLPRAFCSCLARFWAWCPPTA